MAKSLTKRQQKILNFVLDYLNREGYPPTIREIGQAFEIGSLRGVTVHLDALQRKGYISRANTPRSIKVVHPQLQPASRLASLPILGSIAAGHPISAQEDVEGHVTVPPEMVMNVESAFLLRVKGESMVGDGIMDGDLVVIKPQETAREGDIVAVLLGDEATVKRINYGKNGVRLLPSNPNFEPIPVDREDSRIVGKVIGLMRDYEGAAF